MNIKVNQWDGVIPGDDEVSIVIYCKEMKKGEDMKERIEANEGIRYDLVDAADFHDGKESMKIGRAMKMILDKHHVTDIPYCYSEEFFQKIQKDIAKLNES